MLRSWQRRSASAATALLRCNIDKSDASRSYGKPYVIRQRGSYPGHDLLPWVSGAPSRNASRPDYPETARHAKAPLAYTVMCQPGGITVVPPSSSTMAGPVSAYPGGSASRW